MPAGGLEERGGVREVVLAIGVDLKRMRIALGGRMFEPRQKRPALASVDLVAQKRHLGMQGGKPVKLARTLGITCVVDDFKGARPSSTHPRVSPWLRLGMMTTGRKSDMTPSVT